MTCQTEAARRLIHTRNVACRGYLRDDGRWDIVGELLDTKTVAIPNPERGEISAGAPYHSMRLTLTVDDALVIRDALAETLEAPTSVCHEIGPAYRGLVGMEIRAGFLLKARMLVEGVGGCTHLTELLGPIATTAFQTVSTKRLAPGGERDALLEQLADRCYAMRTDGPFVLRYFPDIAR